MFNTKSRLFLLFLVFVLLTVTYSADLDSKSQLTRGNQAIKALNAFPLYFIENRGQVDECVRYHLKMPEANVYLTPEEIVYQFIHRKSEGRFEEKRLMQPDHKSPAEIKVENIRMRFAGANKRVMVEGLEESEGRVSYFRGNDPEKWVSGAHTYKKVLYRELYPHLDLLVYGRRTRIKKEFRVRPGGDVKKIEIRYEGVEQLRVNKEGQLEIVTEEGVLREDAPLSYQMIDGRRLEVKSEYVVEDDYTLKYKIGEYRKDKELIIDPTLDYSTYLGGSDRDTGLSLAVDEAGNAYITGWTSSSDFPVTGGSYDTSYNGLFYDVFITRLNSSGSGFVYSTYLGGSEDDIAYGIVIDGSRNVYVTGYTKSSDFPTTSGAYDTAHNGAEDVFVTKLNSTGTHLVYSTYIGGIADPFGDDVGYKIALDENRNAYVTGITECPTFPTTSGALDTSFDNSDAFVTKLNSSGSDLAYSTFLGGSDWDRGYAIVVDQNSNAFVAGYTASNDFPMTSGAYDTSYNGGYDVFVAKINSNGSDLIYSTYLGGSDLDRLTWESITIDEDGNAYLTGQTRSNDFPTTVGAYDRTYNGNGDAFITKLNSAGSGLDYSTYLGGNDLDWGFAIIVDENGIAYVTGDTESNDFPNTPCAIDRVYNGDYDVFITKLNSAGSGLPFSSYLGGTGGDHGRGIQIDEDGRIYITGFTDSDNFPTTPGANDRNISGPDDAFVTTIIWHQPPVNLSLEREINRSLFVKEAFHTITWEANPLNANIEIWYYRVYRKPAGEGDESYQLIETVSSDIFEYVDGYLDVNASYVYAVTSVNTCLRDSAYSEPVGN
jgi:hypothetical protein